MMHERILYALTDVDEAFIEAAAPRRSAKRRWFRWAAAACVCLIAGLALFSQADRLPRIALPEYSGEGMGFEGLLYYDASELENGNPWSVENTPDALPVYKNGSYDSAGAPRGLDRSEMQSRLERAAKVVGLSPENPEEMLSGLAGDDTPVGLRVTSDGLSLEVLADGTVTLYFPDGLPLPESYHFTHSESTAQEAEAALQYLAETYAGFLQFKEPKLVLGGDRSIDGAMIRSYTVYDAAGDVRDDILNYTFRYAEFAPNDDGQLLLIRLRDGLCCAEKLGEYPLISLQEAERLLLEGRYQTSVPAPVSGSENIAKAELVYRSGPLEETLLPYYRFYVQLSDSDGWRAVQENGLKVFGAYYVPAIPERYLTGLPLYDGHFN